MATRIIDLSMPCSNATDGVTVTRQENPPVYLGHECYAYDLAIESHMGTYFETSSHVFRNDRDTDTIELNDLVLPGVCITITVGHQCICADDLEATGVIPAPGSALLVNTGADTEKYFSRDAAQWMARHEVKLMASNTRLYDCGFETPTGFFVDLFEADIPILANVVNIDQLPERGFTVIALPLRVESVCTVPCRVIAILEG